MADQDLGAACPPQTQPDRRTRDQARRGRPEQYIQNTSARPCVAPSDADPSFLFRLPARMHQKTRAYGDKSAAHSRPTGSRATSDGHRTWLPLLQTDFRLGGASLPPPIIRRRLVKCLAVADKNKCCLATGGHGDKAARCPCYPQKQTSSAGLRVRASVCIAQRSRSRRSRASSRTSIERSATFGGTTSTSPICQYSMRLSQSGKRSRISGRCFGLVERHDVISRRQINRGALLRQTARALRDQAAFRQGFRCKR